MVNYSNFNKSDVNVIPVWTEQPKPMCKQRLFYKNCCLVSVIFAFVIGLSIGIVIPLFYAKTPRYVLKNNVNNSVSLQTIRNVFVNNSYGAQNRTSLYSTVTFVSEDVNVTDEVSDQSVVRDGIYWSDKIEHSLPKGFSATKNENWANYIRNSGIAVKLEHGCGRMQNRLATFQDGSQGCVRYRQNTDQIQGELFSFYLGQILKIPNLAPSTVSVVNLKTPLWKNVAGQIAAAQWNSNRAIVLTKYIPNLDASNIPKMFRPTDRHLNYKDVENLSMKNGKSLESLIELAQWSDLIIFDYLTANLDRIVNNLYNFQWNSNIMDAPAHNLAKQVDNNLLVFLDNESGLLHGYRLLEKYEIYHTILLDNLCIFRKQTADVIRRLKQDGNVGDLLRTMFDNLNGRKIRDVLPTIPDKSIKILNERIDKVYNQISKCESIYTNVDT